MNKLEIIQKTVVEKIAKKYNLKMIIIFGSFASGKSRDDSDLDIAILGAKAVSFKDQISLGNEFSRIFAKNADISVLNSANPLLLFQVSKNALLLYGNEREFMKFKLYAFQRYNDYAPYFEMEKELNKKIIDAYAC